MRRTPKALCAALIAFLMCVPASALADADVEGTVQDNEMQSLDDSETTVPSASLQPTVADGEAMQPLANMRATSTPAEPRGIRSSEGQGDCYLTINYYEIVYYEDPTAPDDGLRYLGQYVVEGLEPGEVVNVWNYVFNIPGHFFFDGTKPEIVISADNSQNVIDLTYGKLANYELTVNYYVMDGADLTASNWHDALATEPVFHKLGEQKFVNQRFDDEINGDDFEFELDGLYTVDTYPQSIRISTDPSENVLNVLYVPEASHLPESIEIVEKPESLETGSSTSAPTPGQSTPPDAPEAPEDVIVPTPLPPSTSDNGDFGAPSQASQMEGVHFTNGQIDARTTDGPVQFTQEMIANPVTEETAERYAQAYEQNESVTTALPAVPATQSMTLGCALLLFLAAFLALCVYAFERGERDK